MTLKKIRANIGWIDDGCCMVECSCGGKVYLNSGEEGGCECKKRYTFKQTNAAFEIPEDSSSDT